MGHSFYDKRRYPIVDVREGYGEWARTYEQTVQDEMDLRLLERLQAVDWSACPRVLDLACGTGRIGEWLGPRAHGAIDGRDITISFAMVWPRERPAGAARRSPSRRRAAPRASRGRPSAE